jgi:hypothetical protein
MQRSQAPARYTRLRNLSRPGPASVFAQADDRNALPLAQEHRLTSDRLSAVMFQKRNITAFSGSGYDRRHYIAFWDEFLQT